MQSSIDNSKSKISDTQSSLDSVVSKIADLNNQIEQKQNEINYLQESIKSLEASITEKKKKLKIVCMLCNLITTVIVILNLFWCFKFLWFLFKNW